MKKVILIVMPFAFTVNPAIGVSLLKAKLKQKGIDCRVKYFNIDFAAMIGRDRYEIICSYGNLFLGERIFAQEYFAEQLPEDHEYATYLHQKYQIPENVINDFTNIKTMVKPFLKHCLETVPWHEFDIIGFSSTFEQNLASITLASRIKKRHTNRIIVFGGANCEEVMGLELHRCFPFIDFICSGEGDFSFPKLVGCIFANQSVEDIPGVVYRQGEKSIQVSSAATTRNLDALPFPDYDDYFSQLYQAFSTSLPCHRLHMETSRGCWWGEKSQCKFCGLNGSSITYRSKSKNRIVRELQYLTEKYATKYGVPQIAMVDNVLDMAYFKKLICDIKNMRLPVQLYYEIKTNLNRDQVKMLSEAGVTLVGPGIESLNTHVLKLMAKGVSAIRNIQLLKYCEQFSISPGWNLLLGFPGEKPRHYDDMTDLIYRIVHLPPPSGALRFTLERFSPYFNYPDKHGIVNVRPERAYRFVYPLEESSLFNLAYYFDFDYQDNVKPPDCQQEISAAVEDWQRSYAANEYLVSIEESPFGLLIQDGRSSAHVSQVRLEAGQKDIYDYCDSIRSLSSIVSFMESKYSRHSIRLRDIRDFLDEMVRLNLMVNEGDRYLSLAIKLEDHIATP